MMWKKLSRMYTKIKIHAKHRKQSWRLKWVGALSHLFSFGWISSVRTLFSCRRWRNVLTLPWLRHFYTVSNTTLLRQILSLTLRNSFQNVSKLPVQSFTELIRLKKTKIWFIQLFVKTVTTARPSSGNHIRWSALCCR